jgi:hypothetical protein
MKTLNLSMGIICIVVAATIFVFADGLRRWYAGIFFLMLGGLMLVNALRWSRGGNQ